MPIRVYFEGPLLRIDVTGTIALKEIGEAVTQIEALESSVAVTPNRITDLTGTTAFGARFPDVFQVANRRKNRTHPNSFKCAVVAPQPADLGLARMFQTLSENPQMIVEIFSDFPSAYAWVTA